MQAVIEERHGKAILLCSHCGGRILSLIDEFDERYLQCVICGRQPTQRYPVRLPWVKAGLKE